MLTSLYSTLIEWASAQADTGARGASSPPLSQRTHDAAYSSPAPVVHARPPANASSPAFVILYGVPLQPEPGGLEGFDKPLTHKGRLQIATS